jgi:hypothetical protein
VSGAGAPVGVSGAGAPVGVSGAGAPVGVSGAGAPVGVSGAGAPVGVSGAGAEHCQQLAQDCLHPSPLPKGITLWCTALNCVLFQ